MKSFLNLKQDKGYLNITKGSDLTLMKETNKKLEAE
jgi:hypothetical protein